MLIVAWVAIPALFAFALAAVTPIGTGWLVAVGAGVWALYFVAVSSAEGGTAYGIILGGLIFAGWTLGALLGALVHRRIQRGRRDDFDVNAC